MHATVVRRLGRPRREETLARREAVLQCAREEFLAHGYRATRMEDIALRAGVSKRTLYFWHADKAALFHACIIDATESIALPPIDPSRDMDAGLADYAASLVLRLSSDDALQMSTLLFREAREFPEIREVVLAGQKLVARPVADLLIAKGMEEAPARQLGRIFGTFLLSEIQQVLIEGGRAEFAERMENRARLVIRIFLEGLRGLE